MAIKYIGLDFDQCICEINIGFWLVYSLYFEGLVSSSFKSTQLPQKWKKALAKGILEKRFTFVNPEMIDLLNYIKSLPEEKRPTVFVYTNNKNADLVAFIHSILEEALESSPWLVSFHPQDPCRAVEQPYLAPDEPGKSFDGINNCLGRPEDLTRDGLLFFDDLLHPLHKELGERYIHINPAFHCHDKMVDYLQSFVEAFQEDSTDEENEKHFRNFVRLSLAQHTRKYIDLFPAPRSAYEEWDMLEWNSYFDLFKFNTHLAPQTVSPQEKSNLFEKALKFLEPANEK
jgi:hypothetical protein